MESLTASADGEPLSFCIVSHGVGDYDQWLDEFKGNCEREEDNFHVNVLKAKLHIGGNAITGDNKNRCLAIGVFPTSNEETLKTIMKFDAPPFVGGPDLIKNGIVIPPFEPNFIGRLVMDRIDNDKEFPPEELMVHVASHGVESFDSWYKNAFEPSKPEDFKALGLVRTLVGQGPDRESDGKETAVVISLFQKSCLKAFQQASKFEDPPFPDFIKNGYIIPPFHVNLFANAIYTHKYE